MAVAGAAAAQQPPPAAPANAPQRTTATYGDWVVQCETQTGPPQQKICDMAQTTQTQGRNVPFSRVALIHPGKSQPEKIVVQVPVSVTVATPVRLQIDDADAGVAVPFARCLPAGCFAEFDVKDDEMKKLRAASGTGKLSFADAGTHEIAIPVSFNGFGLAFDALAKE